MEKQIWLIPGTEDMMPYIYGKTLAGKRASTLNLSETYDALTAFLRAEIAAGFRRVQK